MTHTPGPWRFIAPHIISRAPEFDGKSVKRKVAEISIAFKDSQTFIGNGERIVACVNACDGISNEALDAGAIVAIIEAAEIARLELNDIAMGVQPPTGAVAAKYLERALALINGQTT